jgi:hypothetical protein
VKQDKLLIVLVVLVVIAGLVWLRYFKGDSTTLTAAASSDAQDYQVSPVENPQLHKDRIDAARKTEYKSTGRNIFSAIPPPQPPSKEEIRKLNEQRTQVVPPAPVAPKVTPLPVKFFGYGTVPNGTARVAFFSDGEEVYVVKEGELLLNRFRILKISNANLEYEEVSSGLRGTTPLEEQAAPASPSP